MAQNSMYAGLSLASTTYQQWLEVRVHLKDVLRPELMDAVVRYAQQHGINPQTLCSQVHDKMNERIQGATSRYIREMGGLPPTALIRDYFEVAPLLDYAAINRLARNAIVDRGLEPVQAVEEACDYYLGQSYSPKLVKIVDNIYSQGRRLKSIRRSLKLDVIQLSLFDEPQAS